jgi:hypothetical protein
MAGAKHSKAAAFEGQAFQQQLINDRDVFCRNANCWIFGNVATSPTRSASIPLTFLRLPVQNWSGLAIYVQE